MGDADAARVDGLTAGSGRGRPAWLHPISDSEAPPAHNLPAALTSFVGRARDLAEVGRLLDAHRLVTLVGPGGVGKTRLSVEAAGAVLDDFPHGVWLVELAPLVEAGAVPRAVAEVLALDEDPRRAPVDQLVARLRGQRLLLVLDNCEHVIDGCALLAERLLHSCPSLHILATSREALSIPGEAVWPVAPLGLPSDRLTVTEAIQADAVRLFLDRGRARTPDLTVTDSAVQTIGEICRRLDGIPLAIEMAAAWLPTLTVDELLLRLVDRYHLLTGGSRTALPRHQTLTALIEWSYDRLAEAEQRLLRACSVYGGGWTLEAAEGVGLGGAGLGVPSPEPRDPEPDTLVVMARLVATSMLVTQQQHGATRYRLLETIRQFAAGKLAERPAEEWDARRRHAAYFVGLAERAEPLLVGAEQAAWLDRLDAEHDNLRAALRWSIEQQETETALRLCGALWRYWWTRGHLDEGTLWVERALNGQGAASDAARAGALNGAGALARIRGESTRATALQTEALALWRRVGDHSAIAATLQSLASAAKDRGDFVEADILYEQSLALFREVGNDWGTAMALNNLGINSRAQGQYARAAALCEESLAIRRARGDDFGIAMSLNELSRVARAQSDHERTAQLCAESLPMFRRLGVKRHLAAALELVAWVAGSKSQHTRAARLFGAADAVRTEIGAPLPLNERPDYERAVDATRRALGPTRYGVLFAQGQGLTPDEALALALTPESGAANEVGPALSRREHEVMLLLARGLSNREIAAELVVTPLTAESHVRNVLRKLGLERRGQVAAWAIRHGFVEPPA